MGKANTLLSSAEGKCYVTQLHGYQKHKNIEIS